jgi:hypothetical protein
MHTIEREKPVPFHRDLGVRVSVAWLVVLSLVTVLLDSQLTGLVAVAPFLAAALSERVTRVLVIAVLACVVFVLTATVIDAVWNDAQWIRFWGVVVSGAVAALAGASRERERRNTIGIDEVAREVQRAVMRLQAPFTDRASTALRYRSADVQALIGGDALEAVDTRWGVRFLVADARGKGLASLRASTLTLGAFREWAHVEPDLTVLLDRLHRSLDRELDEDDYVTALVAQLDDLTFSWASAGHPMPMLVRQHQVTELDRDAVPTQPLAMKVPRRPACAGTIGLMAGDVILMVTDGLLEARDSRGRFFPMELEASECLAGPDVGAGVDELIAAASRHSSGALADDIAVAAIRIDDGSRARGAGNGGSGNEPRRSEE